MTHRDKIIEVLRKEGPMVKSKLLEVVSGVVGGTGAARKALDKLVEEGMVVVREEKDGGAKKYICSLAEDGTSDEGEEGSKEIDDGGKNQKEQKEQKEREEEKKGRKDEGEDKDENKGEKEKDLEIIIQDKNVRIPEHLFKFVSMLASMEGTTPDEFVTRAVEDWLILKNCSLKEPVIYGVIIISRRDARPKDKGGRVYDVKDLGEFEKLVSVMDLAEACRIAKTTMDTRKLPAVVMVERDRYSVLVRMYEFLRDELKLGAMIEKESGVVD